jgi:hypothetical protein
MTEDTINAELEYDRVRHALNVDPEPPETLTQRMLAAASNHAELASTLRLLEERQQTVTNEVYAENYLLKSEVAFLRRPRPLWHRVLNVFFPLRNELFLPHQEQYK